MQDRTITELGKLQLSANAHLEPYQQYIEEITPGKVTTVALIMFRKKTNTIEYQNIDVKNANLDNYQNFGYRKGTARGGDVTFTSKFGDLDKKLNVLINSQWPSLLSVAKEVSRTEYELFQQWRQAFKRDKEKIQTDLEAFYSGLDKNKQLTCAFTLAIEINNEIHLPTDFKSIQKQILVSGTEGKKQKYGVISEGRDSLCSICHRKSPILYGFASPFKYATADKPGTVSGFFNQKNNWINYPICQTCSLEFELGKNYVAKHLSRSFFGKRYYLIPKTILPNDGGRLAKALKIIANINYEMGKADQIVQREDYLMERIAGLDNMLSFNLLYYEENPTTKAIKIKLMLEEIPPSRFRTLFIDVPKLINQHTLYIHADYNFKTREKTDLKFSFALIKLFFEDSFYDTIQKLFLSHPISRDQLFGRFMRVIRENYYKKANSGGFLENRLTTILKAHLVLRYFQELRVISTPKITAMTFESEQEQQSAPKRASFDMEKLKKFLADNKEFVYNDAIAGVFSLGIIVNQVFNLQQANLGNTPFEQKLKGLNISGNDLQKIYTESIGKINQYKSQYTYKDLREFVTEHFAVNISKIKKLSNQEVSFYFVSGLELGRKFKSDKESN